MRSWTLWLAVSSTVQLMRFLFTLLSWVSQSECIANHEVNLRASNSSQLETSQWEMHCSKFTGITRSDHLNQT
ncbi:Olfactory Receptor 4D2 [Manis pentadactyla]|nr:Olfactory Receptor 4D2 [Manis pentadactyla]